MISYTDFTNVNTKYNRAGFINYEVVFIFYPNYIKVYGEKGKEIARFNFKKVTNE